MIEKRRKDRARAVREAAVERWAKGGTVLACGLVTILVATAIAFPQSITATPDPSGSDQPSVSAIYTDMTLAMRKQPSPPEVLYDETFIPHGLTVRIVIAKNGVSIAQLVFSSDPSPRTFRVSLSQSGQTDVYDTTTGKHFSEARMFWAATWSRVHPGSTEGNISVEEQAGDTGVNAARQRVIADVIVMSDKYYKVSGGGVESLGSAPVYHLQLSAREDKVAHPLTDLYVDPQSFLVRKAVAAFKNEAVISGDTGTITLDFGRIGGFWMVTSGEISARAHAFFTQAAGSASFAVSNVTFPSPGIQDQRSSSSQSRVKTCSSLSPVWSPREEQCSIRRGPLQ